MSFQVEDLPANRVFNRVLQRPLAEPQGPYRLFLIGISLIFLAGLLAVVVGIFQGLWYFKSSPRLESWALCQAQNRNRLNRETLINVSLQISERRVASLNKALNDPRDLAFSIARLAISEEKNARDTLRRERRTVSVEPLADDLTQLVIGLLLVAVFAFVTARLAALHGLHAVGTWSRDGNSEDWRWPYWSWVAIIFFPHFAREVYTSILLEEKSWFGWNSFCISSAAWGLMIVTALGVSMVIAYPATVLWHFGKRSNRPVLLDIGHRDGKWGVGSYSLFLHTWAILSLVFLLLPSALWLRALLDRPLSIPYLLPPAVLFVSAIAISVRMVWNAVAVRRMYQSQLGKLGFSWQEIQAKNPPPDPTINFIGEHWWQLPAIVSGVLAALWLILQLTGVSDFLLQITGFKIPD